MPWSGMSCKMSLTEVRKWLALGLQSCFFFFQFSVWRDVTQLTCAFSLQWFIGWQHPGAPWSRDNSSVARFWCSRGTLGAVASKLGPEYVGAFALGCPVTSWKAPERGALFEWNGKGSPRWCYSVFWVMEEMMFFFEVLWIMKNVSLGWKQLGALLKVWDGCGFTMIYPPRWHTADGQNHQL